MIIHSNLHFFNETAILKLKLHKPFESIVSGILVLVIEAIVALNGIVIVSAVAFVFIVIFLIIGCSHQCPQ